MSEPANGYLVSLVDAEGVGVALERAWHGSMTAARLRFEEVLAETQIEGTVFLHRLELPAGRGFPPRPPADGDWRLVGSAGLGRSEPVSG